MKALIYESELKYISRCILDYPEIETGGDLFGFWTYSGYPIIQYVIGPGADTYRTVAFFKQDKNFLIENGKFLNEYHGLQHLGNWHSHHRLGIPHPSGHDSQTIYKAIADNNLHQFFLVIGSIEQNASIINGFHYKDEDRGNYLQCPWVVLKGISPLRHNIEKTIPKHLFAEPKTKKPCINNLSQTTLRSETTYYEPLNKKQELWYTTNKGREFIKLVYQELLENNFQVKMFQSKQNIFSFHFPFGAIKFPETFPYGKYIAGIESKRIEKIIQSNKNKIWTEQDK